MGWFWSDESTSRLEAPHFESVSADTTPPVRPASRMPSAAFIPPLIQTTDIGCCSPVVQCISFPLFSPPPSSHLQLPPVWQADALILETSQANQPPPHYQSITLSTISQATFPPSRPPLRARLFQPVVRPLPSRKPPQPPKNGSIPRRNRCTTLSSARLLPNLQTSPPSNRWSQSTTS